MQKLFRFQGAVRQVQVICQRPNGTVRARDMRGVIINAPVQMFENEQDRPAPAIATIEELKRKWAKA
jgi:hypothetical protein